MKSTVLSIAILAVCTLVAFISNGQSSLSVSFPMIWSDVKVKDNWTPSTAPNYKEYREGSAFGYGVNLNYSFQPKFILRNKNIQLDIGAGYYYQRFNIRRPFDYNSPTEPIFRTEHYSYLCLHGDVGVTYKHTFNSKRYFMTFNATYRMLRSFQQNYTPTYNTGTEGFFTQINRQLIGFGKMFSMGVGLDRRLGKRFSIGANVIVPVYTRWRNDKIFRDNPSTFYRPKFSLGTSIRVSYHFITKHLASRPVLLR